MGYQDANEEDSISMYSLIFNSALRRFAFTVATTVVVVMLNIGDIRAPENLKWLITLIFTDVFAYTVGVWVGMYSALSAIINRASTSYGKKSDKIGGEDDRHEE